MSTPRFITLPTQDLDVSGGLKNHPISNIKFMSKPSVETIAQVTAVAKKSGKPIFLGGNVTCQRIGCATQKFGKYNCDIA